MISSQCRSFLPIDFSIYSYSHSHQVCVDIFTHGLKNEEPACLNFEINIFHMSELLGLSFIIEVLKCHGDEDAV